MSVRATVKLISSACPAVSKYFTRNLMVLADFRAALKKDYDVNSVNWSSNFYCDCWVWVICCFISFICDDYVCNCMLVFSSFCFRSTTCAWILLAGQLWSSVPRPNVSLQRLHTTFILEHYSFKCTFRVLRLWNLRSFPHAKGQVGHSLALHARKWLS